MEFLVTVELPPLVLMILFPSKVISPRSAVRLHSPLESFMLIAPPLGDEPLDTELLENNVGPPETMVSLSA
ncbi:Uncharacterised protein [Chlamydia abortus]|nr:Uncharacterised protein [Chlamydia abortus]SFW01675.1 Uncharacterised protein [Chlamydia abortus]SFW02374.1 Uncharacterised protein [Chlamydia abortus]SFW03836.1 Uncharacterised protein [Chlamydia abortus]SGA29284.1 Uncharacterised protein [Chlamydia abortus]